MYNNKPFFVKSFVFYCIAFPVHVSAQNVIIQNATHIGAALEVGETVRVMIVDAAPLGQVTVIQNGEPPFFFGTTDVNGSWSVTNLIDSLSYVGAYHQRWFVNGVEMVPTNSPDILAFAPKLPNFSIYAPFVGPNCPTQSTVAISCRESQSAARRWVYSPVNVFSYSSLAPSVINTAISRWNQSQQKISLQSSAFYNDVEILDEVLPSFALARTFTWSHDCTQCFNKGNECNGQCFTAETVAFVDIEMDLSRIGSLAQALQAPFSEVASHVLTHELGHALRLGDTGNLAGTCSEAQSIMYGIGSVAYSCGRQAPNSCDISGINTVYPNAVPVCASGFNYCFVEGPSCN